MLLLRRKNVNSLFPTPSRFPEIIINDQIKLDLVANKVPPGFTHSGSIDLSGCLKLIKLPSGLTVRGILILNNCFNLCEVGDFLQAEAILFVNCVSLKQLPAHVKAKRIDFSGSGLVQFPCSLDVDSIFFDRKFQRENIYFY